MRKRYQLLNVDVDVDQQEKALLWTTAHTQDPQGTASVFLEMEKRILQWLKEIKNLLKQHAPQLLKVFKMRSLLVWFGLVWFGLSLLLGKPAQREGARTRLRSYARCSTLPYPERPVR